eukprot:1576460-Rhodomonas_salina.2
MPAAKRRRATKRLQSAPLSLAWKPETASTALAVGLTPSADGSFPQRTVQAVLRAVGLLNVRALRAAPASLDTSLGRRVRVKIVCAARVSVVGGGRAGAAVGLTLVWRKCAKIVWKYVREGTVDGGGGGAGPAIRAKKSVSKLKCSGKAWADMAQLCRRRKIRQQTTE